MILRLTLTIVFYFIVVPVEAHFNRECRYGFCNPVASVTPPSGNGIITEASDPMVAENGDRLITE